MKEELTKLLDKQLISITSKILYFPCRVGKPQSDYKPYHLYRDVILIPLDYGVPDRSLYDAMVDMHFPEWKERELLWRKDKSVRKMFEHKMLEVMELYI